MPKISIVDILAEVHTPSFIYDENSILESLNNLGRIRSQYDFRILFPLKSFAIVDCLFLIAKLVDGFSASSFFETQLARDILNNQKSVHMTTPGLRSEEIEVLSELCDYMAFNSLEQWKRYYKKVSGKTSCGVRVNPQLSFIRDNRYDPCKRHSKLGIPISDLSKISENGSKALEGVKGLHFHTNCE